MVQYGHSDLISEKAYLCKSKPFFKSKPFGQLGGGDIVN
jgi:hypothetical protein